jgi:5-methyltetrahydrofolate--homocysteine methyltransferase
METRITSATREVIIADNRPTVIIGERINPSGNKKLAEALRQGDLEVVKRFAVQQVEAGADIVDVNVSTFGVDEVAMLPAAVKAVMEAVPVPLCIDTANPVAMEAALKVYVGKPLVNSVSGEEKSLKNVLPLVKKFGTAMVGLAQDDNGVPKDAERRIAVANKIITLAEAAGVSRENIIIDCLAPAVGADTAGGPMVLAAMYHVKNVLGVNQVLGASNVSFGLPEREVLNTAFIPLAVNAGMTCLVTNAAKARMLILAVDLLLGRDKRARRYVEAYRAKLAKAKPA